ncbi:unnamed protein product [Thelazia callipaeda]|uniref:Transmembrane protein n=1 Tax=Thelazia callipaeda TaxID=103827 RepID=A0A0N5CKB7_THECL|nr:unnamed protein product [Thelazia callipaeda]
MDHLEGSGNSHMVEWSDDEDLGAEGSGIAMEGSADELDEVIIPAINVEDVRRLEPTIHTTIRAFTEIKAETRSPSKPPVIAKPPEAGSSNRSMISTLITLIFTILISVTFS